MAQKKKKQEEVTLLHMKDGRTLRVLEKTGKYFFCDGCKLRIKNPGIECVEHVLRPVVPEEATAEEERAVEE